jgi:hypothetical protein
VFSLRYGLILKCYLDNLLLSVNASKEVGLKVNPEKTKHMVMSRCQKAGPKHIIKIANRSFEHVS